MPQLHKPGAHFLSSFTWTWALHWSCHHQGLVYVRTPSRSLPAAPWLWEPVSTLCSWTDVEECGWHTSCLSLLPVSLPCSSHFILWVHLLLFLSLKGYLFMQDSRFKFTVVIVALTMILGLREVCHLSGGLQSRGTSAQTSKMANHFPLGDWIFGYVHHSLNFGGKVGQVKCQTSSIFVTHCPLD